MASVSWGAKEAGGRSRIRRTISLISFPILLNSEKTAERDEAFSALMHSERSGNDRIYFPESWLPRQQSSLSNRKIPRPNRIYIRVYSKRYKFGGGCGGFYIMRSAHRTNSIREWRRAVPSPSSSSSRPRPYCLGRCASGKKNHRRMRFPSASGAHLNGSFGSRSSKRKCRF